MIVTLLYGVLGFALASMGIGVLEKPFEFFTILSLTLAIGVASANRW